MSSGAIILQHLGYHGIEAAETLAAVEEQVRQGDRHSVVIDQQELVSQTRVSRDWSEIRRHTVSEFAAKVRPLMQAHPAYRLQYFGTAPIPVTMLLGMEVSTWSSVDVFQRHHTSKDWKWRTGISTLKATLDLDGVPQKASPARGDVVIRVGVSYTVDPQLTHAVVAVPLAAIDLLVEPVGLDVVNSPAEVENIANQFRHALDIAQNRFPNANLIHVFASVPAGVAFRMGTVISPTIHPRIQLYELDRAGTSRGYYPAFVLQDSTRSGLVASPEELVLLDSERALWQRELDQLKRMASLQRASWADDVLESCASYAARLAPLSSMRDLRGINASIDLETRDVPDSFKFEAQHAFWRLSDDFLLSILRRIRSEEDRQRSIRIFLLHESQHDAQCLTAGMAAEIGRFGKLLEEADYQADVWAILHEYRYSSTASKSPAPTLFCEILRVAMETMMAFDDAAGATDEMQARRISRYLIWTWQSLELERATSFGDCVEILCEKPTIEIAGLHAWISNRRTVCSLNPERTEQLEIAVLRRTGLHRFASGPAARLDLILQGLQEHQASLVREYLRPISDQVLTHSKK